MDITFQQLTDEPILVITLSGHFAEGFDEAFDTKVIAAVQQTPGRDYLIIDARGVESTFEDIIAFLKLLDQHEDIEISLDELAMPPIFVGSNQFVNLYINKALPTYFHTTDTPVFRTLEEALTFARQHRDQ